MLRGIAHLFIGGVVLLTACAPASPEPAAPTLTPLVYAVKQTPLAYAGATSAPATEEPAPTLTLSELGQPSPPATTGVALFEYTVQSGDTLFGLAVEFGVPMAALQLQNDLGSATGVKVGDVLVIPPTVGWEGASTFWVVHEVQEGEVLSTIAAMYGLDVATLQTVNGLSDADLLSVGQALILPLDAPADTVAEAHRPTPTPPPTATATPVPPSPTVTLAATVAPDDGETPTRSPTAAPATVAPPADTAALAVEIFRLINAERAAQGLPPLAWNETLARAAQLHADDCHARGWCGHTGSDGSTMKERITRAGYDPARWSECWAWYRTAEGAVAAWMDETPPNDPHRRTILSTWLTEVGVGVVPGNGHGYYFIADFGTPRE